MEDFESDGSHNWQDKIPIRKYRSKSTGLRILLGDVEGPTVNGYFTLATEAHDDDGLPHTLEHLIFLGSKNYPYKGILDLLANRCMSDGTNAWTDTDHTAYTVTTGGRDGFLNLLPIYVEHVLFPTLSDSGYVTEVHHVNGDGEDAGVVYCEMQGRENSGESRCHLEMLRAMYPESGYKSETGGIMKNLRESTSNEKVRQYHKDFYRSENLVIIITGKITIEEIVKALEPVMKMIREDTTRKSEFVRPWGSPVAPLKESVSKDIKYPCDEEDNGMVFIAWRGPSAVKNYQATYPIIILMEYLTETSISPLQAAFVEVEEDPLASSVDYSIIENSESCIYLEFSNVPVKKIPEIEGKLNQVLSELKNINMERMKTIIERRVLSQLSNLENSPHESIAFLAIGEFLYGQEPKDLDVRFDAISAYKELFSKSEDYWIKLMNDTLLHGSNRIVIRGIPSVQTKTEMADEEKLRIEKQKEKYGVEGLKKLEEIVEQSIEKNEREIPQEILKSVPIPSVDHISFHPIEPFDEGGKMTSNGSLKMKTFQVKIQFRLHLCSIGYFSHPFKFAILPPVVIGIARRVSHYRR